MEDDGCDLVGCGMTELFLKPCHGSSGSSSWACQDARSSHAVTGSDLK
jgi:hypothetical protein